MYLRELKDCRLVVSAAAWRFAEDHAQGIAENWRGAVAQNRTLYNGDVFIVERWSIDDGVLAGRSLSTKFAAYLYWRGAGAATPYSEAFALAVVRSRDGGVLLAQSVPGTLNAGFYGTPGGLLDARDVGPDGVIDLAGAAARELEEETGLTVAEVTRQCGYLLAHVPPYLGVASVFHSDLAGADLVARVHGYLEAQTAPELCAPCMINRVSELERLALTPFANLLTTHVLGM